MTLRTRHPCSIVRALFLIGAVFAYLALPLLSVRAQSTAESDGYLNLRTAPATTSTIVDIVPPSASLTIRGEAQGGYYPVVYGEEEGWVATDLVKLEVASSSVSNQPAEQSAVASSQVEMRSAPAAAQSFDANQLLPDGMATLVESVNLRSGPGIDFDAVQVVDAGNQVEATGEISNGYERVKFGNKDGWVRSIYVDRGPEAAGDLVRRARDLAAVVEAGWPMIGASDTMFADAEVVLREHPDISSKKIGVIPEDARIQLTGNHRDGYLEVTFDGKQGWVSGEYLRLAQIPPNSPPTVPVLMYHSIQAKGAEYQVTAAQLEEQLQWLSQHGYESITSAELLAWMTYGAPLPEKPIIISIDDGNSTDWLFLELLERYGFQGVFSLPNYAQMTASQIRTLDRAGEVCGHSVSHENLSTLSYEQQLYQVAENKKYLENILGNEITCFAYPFGAYNSLTPYVVIEAGYLMAFDVSGGPQPLDGTIDRWHILRINVNGYGTLDDFIASLQM